MTSPPPPDRLLFRVLPGAMLSVAAAAWVWLALSVHTLPVVGGELDNYTTRAQALLEGRLSSDQLHPMGLPLVLAGLGLFGIEPFLGGRLFGVGCGLMLVTCTYLLLRTWAARPVAALAAAAVGTSQYVLVCAVQACTDVPSAAFLALALLCWTRCATAARAAGMQLVLGGFGLGFAACLRTPAMALLPAFLPVLLSVDWRERLRRVGWSSLGGGLGIAPHVVTLWLGGESLFRNSSQIVWKYRYRHDDAAFLAYQRDPTPVPWHEQIDWWRQGLGDWLGYQSTQLGAPWSLPGSAWSAVVVSLWMTVAMLLPLLLRQRSASVLAIGACVYSLALCVFSLPMDRLTIPMAAPVVVLSTLAWAGLPRRLRALPLLLAALAAIAAFASLPRTLARFENLHARAEMAAARQLVAEHGAWISVATPAIGLDPSVPCLFACYSPSPDVPGAPASHWGRLLADPAARAAQFVVIGRRTWPEVFAELSTQPPPPGYELRAEHEVLIFAKTQTAPWCEAATAELVGHDIHLGLRLAATVDRAMLAGAGFLVRAGANGEWRPMLLPAAADGTFATVLPGDPAAATARWTFVPAIIQWDGARLSGRPIEIMAPVSAATVR